MSYVKRVFSRALQMTRSDFRLVQIRPVVVRALLWTLVLGLLLLFQFPGVADKVGYAAIGVLAGAIIFAVVFVINLLLAPAALQKEAEDTIERLGKQLEDKEAREAALKVLWTLREKGVALRNEPVRSDAALVLWVERVQSWRSEVLSEAGKVNINLMYYLETLNELGKPPTMPAWGPDHINWLTIMSEILRRLEGFLCKTL